MDMQVYHYNFGYVRAKRRNLKVCMVSIVVYVGMYAEKAREHRQQERNYPNEILPTKKQTRSLLASPSAQNCHGLTQNHATTHSNRCRRLDRQWYYVSKLELGPVSDPTYFRTHVFSKRLTGTLVVGSDILGLALAVA